MTKAFTTLCSAVFAVALVACADDPDALAGRGASSPASDPAAGGGGAAGGGEPDPAQCTGRDYKTFDKRSLTAGRVVARLGTDRGRVKPFSALTTEYARVLGKAPASLGTAASTFAQAPPRWYAEPEASAVGMGAAYGIAFEGCLGYTATAPEYASAPDAASAAKECAAMARRFWSKTPTPEEIAACEKVATTGSAPEPSPRRRWAYACASVLTAAGFMTY